jgi:hypothetical protein
MRHQHETERRGVIVVYPFGIYREAQFLDDPAEIDRLILNGGAWRVVDAVLITTASQGGSAPNEAEQILVQAVPLRIE